MKIIKKTKEKPKKVTSSRRGFLKGGSLASAAAAAGFFTPSLMQKANSSEKSKNIERVRKKTICTHCSVGCGIYAETTNGVWTHQEPAFDHPFNLGSHCAKGAAIRELAHGERRLKEPMKLVNGKWEVLSWDDAINEVGDKLLDIYDKSGPDSVFWLGSAKHNNEQAYLFRKFAALFGTNNVDHQARLCHSTTVAGVANTWGYGAMTNSLNDIHNAKSILVIGGNPAEAHPVSLKHIFKATEAGAKLTVVDPRFTRTAAHADHYVRVRPGTDVAFIWGMLWHIFKNGWQDDKFIEQRVFGMEDVRKEVEKWTPDEVLHVSGVDEETCRKAAEVMAKNRPSTFIWCMGGTQHTIGNNYTRAYCIFQLALGNMGVSGGGTNIFRGHDNVQGATDLGVLSDTLPGYYGLSEGAWKHWSKVWSIDYSWLQNRFKLTKYSKKETTMFDKGIPVSRWMDGVLEDKEKIAQSDNLKAMVFWGHAAGSQARGKDVQKAMNKLDMLLIVDPHPTVASIMHEREDGVYLLPACTQMETYGSVTATNRSLQWRDKVIEPLYNSLPDHTIIYKLAKKLGFSDELTKNIKVNNDEPLIEDITREFNNGLWTIGYTGQSPERLKSHQKNWHTFHKTTLKAEGGEANGDFYGLPWPCWGTADIKHPGTPNLYDTSKSVKDGGLTFRARFGISYEGTNILAEGSYSKDSEIKDGYPEFSSDLLKDLGWWDDLTDEEKQKAEGKNWKTDLSGGIQRVAIKHGCSPFGNAKARCKVWTFPDPIPVHREPLYTNRRDLVDKYKTYEDRESFWRLPTRYASIQGKDVSDKYPLILTSGRLVEYEGGGDETRSNPWLAELQQDMFAEINPKDANDNGIKDEQMIWLEGAEGAKIKVKALITRRVAPGVVFIPFHFAGIFEGKDISSKYPEGSAPYVVGESANTAFTYGYDSVTQMQETKCSLCKISLA